MKSKKAFSSRTRKEFLYDILFLSPQFIVYSLLTILPFIIAIPLAFTNVTSILAGSGEFVGINNFISVFKPPIIEEFLPALTKTATFTILNYVMMYLFGLSLALLMYEISSKLKRSFFTIIYLPFMISGLGIGMLFMVLFSKDTGSINLLLLSLGLISNPVDISNTGVATIVVPLLVGWRYAGFNMALFLSGLLSIPNDTIEASRVDGVNYLKRLWYIYLPQMIPTLTIATILCFIGSFGVFDEPVGLGALQGRPSVRVLSILLYRIGFSISGSAGTLSQGVAMSFVVYLPLIVIALIMNKIQKRLQY